MDIQLSVQSSAISVKTAQLNFSQWFLGQILNATVIGKKSADTLLLKIGNQEVEANDNKRNSIPIGERLKLVVEKNDTPVILRVIQQKTIKEFHDIKQSLLRESIPKQAGMDKLTTILNKVVSSNNETIKQFPAPIEQQFKKIIDSLPSKSNLTNGLDLKTTIKNSGLFLEEKLLTEVLRKKPEVLVKNIELPGKTNSEKPLLPASTRPQTPLNHQAIKSDFKANLMQFTSALSNYLQHSENENNILNRQLSFIDSKSEKNVMTKDKLNLKAMESLLKTNTEFVSKQIEASIARIEVNQSKIMVTHDNQSLLWSVEIPVKDKEDIDLLKLNIEADKESNKNNGEQQLWKSSLKINFVNIGSIAANLSILNNEVNVTLWSENEDLNALIHDNLYLLDERIERCGLATGKIICLNHEPTKPFPILNENNLINITI